MTLTVVTPPVTEPISLNEAKLHLRVAHNDDDTYIQSLISVARDHIEQDIQRAIATQTWELTMTTFPTDTNVITLYFGPVQSIVSIIYDDADGVAQTMDPATYWLDTSWLPAKLMGINAWPATSTTSEAVRVQYVAGYGGNPIPSSLRHAMLMLIGEWYDNREAASTALLSKLPHAVDRLIWNYRTFYQ